MDAPEGVWEQHRSELFDVMTEHAKTYREGFAKLCWNSTDGIVITDMMQTFGSPPKCPYRGRVCSWKPIPKKSE